MNVVDSSGWLEYFGEGKNARVFAPPIEDLSRLIVPTISIVEVFKKILQQSTEQAALQAVAHMNQGKTVDLDVRIAMQAAKIGAQLKLPLADSIILATAQSMQAVLWTQDEDFKGISGVRFFPKH